MNNLIQIAPVAAVGLTYLGVRWALRQKVFVLGVCVLDVGVLCVGVLGVCVL